MSRTARSIILAVVVLSTACSSGGNGDAGPGETSDGGSDGGGSGTVPAAVFAAGFCETFLGWVSSVEQQFEANSEAFDSLEAEFGDEQGPEVLIRVRDAVVEGLEGFRTATEQVVSRLDAIGSPDVVGGEDLGVQLRGIFADVVIAADGYAERARNLGTDDADAFIEALFEISSDIEAELTGIFATFDTFDGTFDDPALAAALANEPACAGVG